MTMAMETFPCFPLQSALTWGHGEPSVIPTENTFVNVAPPRESLRRLRTTPGRLEKNKVAFSIDDEETQEISYLPQFFPEPTSMWAQPRDLHIDSTQCEWTSNYPGPMRETLDRLSTEALRENLLNGAVDFPSCQEPWKVDEAQPNLMWTQPIELHTDSAQHDWNSNPKPPMRETLDRLSTEALREKMLEDAMDMVIGQDPWKVNEVEPTLLWAQTVETSSPEIPMREALDRLSTEALRENLLEGGMDAGSCQPWKIDKVQAALPVGHTEPLRIPLTKSEQTMQSVKGTSAGHVSNLEQPRRLNTKLGQLEGTKSEDTDTVSFCNNEMTETKESPVLIPSSADPNLIWAQPTESHNDSSQQDWMRSPKAPTRGTLDRLSTESLREKYLEMALAPESCQDPWQVGGDNYPTQQPDMSGCAMLPLFHPGIPMMEQFIPACTAPDVFNSSVFTGLTNMPTWMPQAPPSDWQDDSIAPGATRFHFQASVSKLKTRDRTIVLDQFEFPLCGENVPFRIQITAKKVHDRKHGQCFQTARGKGYLELKCEGVPPKNSEPVKFRFFVGSGYTKQIRGPVTHNFYLNSVAKLPADQQEWDFMTLSDQNAMTVSVCIEVATDSA